MPTDSGDKGQEGEQTVNHLLARYFRLTAKPSPDPEGKDHAAHIRPDHLNLLADLDLHNVEFAFQTKYTVRGFAVKRSILDLWVNSVHEVPVILIHVTDSSFRQPAVEYLILFDWLIENPDWRYDHRKDHVHFPLAAFEPVEGNGEGLYADALKEARRVRGRRGPLFLMSDTADIPLNLSDLLRSFGKLERVEVPYSILRSARREGHSTDQQIRSFLRLIWQLDETALRAVRGNGEIRAWWEMVLNGPFLGTDRFQRIEFRKFVQAMRDIRARETSFYFPTATWEATTCWRVFTQLFPESTQLIQRVLKTPDNWSSGQIGAAALLASTLANGSDETRADEARGALNDAYHSFGQATATNSDQFYAIELVNFAQAEAMGGRYELRFFDFMDRHSSTFEPWLHKLGQRYYRDPFGLILEQASVRKLAGPKKRDLNVARVNAAYIEIERGFLKRHARQ